MQTRLCVAQGARAGNVPGGHLSRWARSEDNLRLQRERETNFRNNIRMKEDNKTVSLTTSKVNYIDPRIVLAWTQREDVPPSKVFSKTLIKKFTWAAGVDPNYKF
jgi:DNA topoisomerase-1